MVNNKLIIGIIVLIAIVAIVGGVLLTSQESDFPVEVIVGGEKFRLPEGYKSTESMSGSASRNSYTNTDGKLISIQVISFYSLDDLVRTFKSVDYDLENSYTYNTTYAGYTGVKLENSRVNIFLFEKNGKAVSIGIPSNFDENEYFPKIIG